MHVKNLAQQVQRVQTEPSEEPAESRFSTKLGDDYVYLGLKEALNEFSEVFIRTQLQNTEGVKEGRSKEVVQTK